MKIRNPAIHCGLCLYSIGYGSRSISSLLFGSNKRGPTVKDWINTHKPPSRQPRNPRVLTRKPKLPPKQRPWTIAKCGRCLYALGFGYHRIARQMFGVTKRSRKIGAWMRTERPFRPQSSLDSLQSAARLRVRHFDKVGRKPHYIPKIRTTMRWSSDLRRLKKYLRRKVWQFFKHGLHPKSTAKLVGCSRDFFRQWISGQFTGRMTFENYGSLWELDHIKPCFQFNLVDPVERAECFHYTNFQPLIVRQNRRKSAKSNHAAQMPLLLDAANETLWTTV